MRRFVSIFAALSLIATACGAQPPSGTQQEAGATAGEEPLRGGRIVDASISDIKTLNPVLSSDTASSAVWQMNYIGLTRVDPDNGQIIPNLAEKVDLAPDGKTLTYTLRDNLVWSDGVPFTGEDYKYTAEAVMRSKRTVRKPAFAQVVGAKDYQDGKTDTISGIQVTDNGKKITIQFTTPFCPALAQLGGAGAGGIIPKHHFIKHWDNKSTDTSKNIDDNPLNMAPPAAMGPFVFKEHKAGIQATLVRNDKFFRGPPLVDEYIVKIYADNAAVKAALLTGEVTYSGIAAQDWDELSKTPSLRGSKFPGLGSTYIGWNPNNPKVPWLADKRVRQALNYGLNVDLIIEKVRFGFASRVFAYSVPVQWSFDPEGLNTYKYDPAKAKQLIESTGARMGPDGIYRWSDGKPMTVRIETNSGNVERESLVQIAQEQYGQIGIKVEPLLESFPALTENTRYGKPNWEGFILGFSYGIDPDPYGIWHSSEAHATGFNRVGFKSADKLLEAQRNGPDCSQASRKKVIHEVDKLLNDEVPWTFLYAGDSLVFAQKSLQNFDPKPFSTGSLWSVEKWWLKP